MISKNAAEHLRAYKYEAFLAPKFGVLRCLHAQVAYRNLNTLPITIANGTTPKCLLSVLASVLSPTT